MTYNAKDLGRGDPWTACEGGMACMLEHHHGRTPVLRTVARANSLLSTSDGCHTEVGRGCDQPARLRSNRGGIGTQIEFFLCLIAFSFRRQTARGSINEQRQGRDKRQEGNKPPPSYGRGGYKLRDDASYWESC